MQSLRPEQVPEVDAHLVDKGVWIAPQATQREVQGGGPLLGRGRLGVHDLLLAIEAHLVGEVIRPPQVLEGRALDEDVIPDDDEVACRPGQDHCRAAAGDERAEDESATSVAGPICRPPAPGRHQPEEAR